MPIIKLLIYICDFSFFNNGPSFVNAYNPIPPKIFLSFLGRVPSIPDFVIVPQIRKQFTSYKIIVLIRWFKWIHSFLWWIRVKLHISFLHNQSWKSKFTYLDLSALLCSLANCRAASRCSSLYGAVSRKQKRPLSISKVLQPQPLLRAS